MEFSSFLVYWLTFIGVLLYEKYLHALIFSPLRNVPAPSSLCHFSASWFEAKKRSKQELRTLQHAHSELGPIIRVGPAEISLASPEGLRMVYTAGLDKHPWYLDEFMNFDRTSLVSMLDHATHSAQKRVISNLYAKSYLLHSEDMESLSSEILFKRYLPVLESATTQDQSVEVFGLAQWAGLDAMTAYLFGLKRSTNFVQDVGARENYFLRPNPQSQDLKATKRRREAVGMDMCEQTVLALEDPQSLAEEKPASRPVVFERLYRHLLETTKQQGLSRAEALRQTASEMQDAMLAAEETTAITITYILYHLSQNPELQNALHEEVCTLSPPLRSTTGALPPAASIAALPLLESIVSETLRLHAAAPARQPRLVPAGGVTIHGHFIPAGTTVSSNAYSLHRDTQVFPDPETWDARRWLPRETASADIDVANAESERLKMMRRHFWAFGSGGRMCIGSNFALQIIKLQIVAIYTNFTTELADVGYDVEKEMQQTDTYISRPVGDRLLLKFRWRKEERH